MAGQDAGDQVIGAQEIGLAAQVVQHRPRFVMGRLAQGFPQEFLVSAMMRQREQVLFRPAKQGLAQGSRQ